MASHHETTEYVRGEMDTQEQERTFHGFIKFAGWTLALSIGAVIFAALANA